MGTVATLAAGLTVAAAALLSPAPLEAQQPARHEWTASAGRATLAFRDVSRAIRPVDASPIAWQGSGPALRGRYDRLTRVSAHRVDVTWARASRFAYASPLRRVVAAADDDASLFSTRYGYTRYFFRDLGVHGLDLGAAAEAAYQRATQRRQYAAFLLRETSHGYAFGGAIAARFARWRRFSLEAWWTNGLRMSNQHDAFEGGGPPPRDAWGGGWYDEWLMTGRVRMTRAMWLLAELGRTSEVYYAHNAADTARASALLLGVTYER